MMELAKSSEDTRLTKTREIAERQNIPLKYLEQIINLLKKHKLVSSVRGAEGGYRIARSSQEITVYEILRALEGDLSVTARNDKYWGKEQGIFWSELEEKIKTILDIPLSDFVETSRNTESGMMYYI